MTVSPSPDEQDWREHHTPTETDKFRFEFVFEMVAVIASVVIGRALFPGDASYWTNVYMTLIGVLITVLVLDRRAERRDRLREERELKTQLVRDASSIVNDVAVNAVHQMKKRGWLDGDKGLLAGVDLSRANLQGVDLTKANLQKANLNNTNLSLADLRNVNLQGANLRNVNLQGADLSKLELQGLHLEDANLQEANLLEANLQEAYLGAADLQKANLQDANLQGANLRKANLQEAYLGLANLQRAILFRARLQNANLWRANLQEADLEHARLQGVDLSSASLLHAYLGEDFNSPELDKTTILPDGNFWTPETDLKKFTNPRNKPDEKSHDEDEGGAE
ncbi:MAG TPA: pentapeptide repeat-containing protein [Phototrophicaceae bacterium]|jgi:uncharacterized protein YjbI with pentapeptide repeats|nr:pentapeptide repeat-containing protein [Phototrophicaceae bacterium]